MSTPSTTTSTTTKTTGTVVETLTILQWLLKLCGFIVYISISGVMQRINQALAITFYAQCYTSQHTAQLPYPELSYCIPLFLDGEFHIFVHFLEMYVFLFKRNPASHYTMFILLLYSKSSRLSVRLSVCLTVRLSIRNVPVSDENGLTYRHSFFTIR